MKPDRLLKNTLILGLIVLAGLLISTIIGLVGQDDDDRLSQVEREVEVILYRFGAMHLDDIDSFKSIYNALRNTSFDVASQAQLESYIFSDSKFDQSVTLLMDDGRRFEGKRLKSTAVEQVNIHLFDDPISQDNIAIEIEAYNNDQNTLVAVISRKIEDKQSGKKAILLKELNLNHFVSDFKRLFGQSAAKLYLVDSSHKFVDLLGTTDQEIDLAGVGALIKSNDHMGGIQVQTINDLKYDVITRNIAEFDWKLVILYNHQEMWVKNSGSIVWSSILLGLVTLIFAVLILYFRQVEKQIHALDSLQDVYSVFNQNYDQSVWENESVHIGKTSLSALQSLLPYLAISESNHILIESALNKTRMTVFQLEGVDYRTTQTKADRDHLLLNNRELGMILERYFLEKCSKVPLTVDVSDMNNLLSFDLIQLLMVLAELIDKSQLHGRVELKISPDRDILLLEFYGDVQWHVTELYKLMINNSEYYYLFETIGLLKMGSKLAFNPKVNHDALENKPANFGEQRTLPKQVYFMNDIHQGGVVLQLMIKSLGIELLPFDIGNEPLSLVSKSVDNQIPLILSAKDYGHLGKKEPTNRIIVYGETENFVLDNILLLERPYQLNKLEYVLLLVNKESK